MKQFHPETDITVDSDTRIKNRARVLAVIVAEESCTRQHIVELTGLSKATVSRAVRDLETQNLIVEAGRYETTQHHSLNNQLSLNARLGHVCGVDIGGTNTRVVLSGVTGAERRTWFGSSPYDLSGVELADWLTSVIFELLGDTDVPLLATAVGVPGVVNSLDHSISQAPNLPKVLGSDFAQQLKKRLPGQVDVLNDSNIAAVGEYLAGAARGTENAVVLTVGTGLGAGVILQHALLRGRLGVVGEFGLLPLDGHGQILEDILSAKGLGELARVAGLGELISLDILTREGAAFDVIRERVIEAMHMAAVMSATAYEADIVVFGGAVSVSLEHLLPEVERRLSILEESAPFVKVSALGTFTGVLGAVALALKLLYVELAIDDNSALDSSIQRILLDIFEDLVPTSENLVGSGTPARPGLPIYVREPSRHATCRVVPLANKILAVPIERIGIEGE